jgi:hypothetical protein
VPGDGILGCGNDFRKQSVKEQMLKPFLFYAVRNVFAGYLYSDLVLTSAS